jgi:hypothetical protein
MSGTRLSIITGIHINIPAGAPGRNPTLRNPAANFATEPLNFELFALFPNRAGLGQIDDPNQRRD